MPWVILSLTQALVGPSTWAQEDANKVGETTPPTVDQRYRSLELFQRVLHFVEKNYVEEVKEKDLIEGAIKGMLETLDPHSNFLSAEIFREMKVDTSGKFGGVGLEIGLKEGALTVVTPMEESPAWRAGIKPGDRIVRIDGESTKGLGLSEAAAKMRGKPKTQLRVTIVREGLSKPREFTLERDIIRVQSVRAEELEKGIGYVRLASFSESAAKDVHGAIEKMEQKAGAPLKGLILDLRMNPGGLLDQAVDVSSLFIDEGTIVSTMGRDTKQREVRLAKRGLARKDFALAVLVNGSSASAAEIVAGAIQDHGRGLILGAPTFGKGSVQTVVELGGDLGLKLTVARYYTPSGRSIQEKGVQPDIVLDDFDPKLLSEAKVRRDGIRERDLKRRIRNTQGDSEGGEESGDERKNEGSTKAAVNRIVPKEDFQVREAVSYLKAFEVFRRMNRVTGDKTAPSEGAKTPSG